MKYIRTKYKIIDLTSKQVSSYKIVDDKTAVDEYGEDSGFIMVYYYNRDIGEHIEYDNKCGYSMDNWYLKDILKQAETIEELCDGYVVEHPINAFKFFYDKEEVFGFLKNTCANMFKFCELCIYSVIKTDKGLIYVAKMNEKGEFELL